MDETGTKHVFVTERPCIGIPPVLYRLEYTYVCTPNLHLGAGLGLQVQA